MISFTNEIYFSAQWDHAPCTSKYFKNKGKISDPKNYSELGKIQEWKNGKEAVWV